MSSAKVSTMGNSNKASSFFTASYHETDKELLKAMEGELARQQHQIELIASENIASQAVISAQGSVFTNKYAEGYPGKRYYGGCEYADVVEQLAIDRAKKLFGADYVNVQPNSGSQANQGVFNALLKPGDTILGQSLAAGGHLTHGAAPNQSGKWFKAVQYGVKESDALIDYDQVERLAKEHKPKLIIAGFSAYPRVVDWQRFRTIADSVGALLMVDMAHVAGLVAAGSYPSPVGIADITTTTTHKTLRGPRGGMILARNGNLVVRKTESGKDVTLSQAINSSIFPGIQGGPLVHVIAGKAVCFAEALQPEFKKYGQQVIDNARALAAVLKKRGADIVSGGTDNHIVLVDLRPKKLTGKQTEESLERAGLTCNKNAIPFDPARPMVTSGVRLGTPAGTTRGFGVKEFEHVGELIGDVLDGLAKNPENNGAIEKEVHAKVRTLCDKFPIYSRT
ncbi:MAG: serine hydroxymethyltransferase [Proteobacteria bacterium]|nr:serine hydroxymethyltransferase [Pseudomonadota bacterium]